MKKSLKVSVLATAIAVALPSWVGAAGLGGINVFSALGQPLRAEIELQATAEELDGMVAAVPDMEAFRQANMAYSPLVADIQISIERHGSRPVLRVSSDKVINEPFMDLLVEVSWAAGRLVREYTFLLDPVDMRPAQAARVNVPASTPRAARPQASSTTDRHIVRRGETLNRIASNYLPPDAQLDQMLIALLRENPDAFADGNINRLRAGSTLVIPDENSVASVSVAQARSEIRAQGAEFEAYRNRLAGAVVARPAARQEPLSRESTGEIEPRVESRVQAGAGVDQVQVSGAPVAEEVKSDSPVVSPDVPAASIEEEDLVARERELQDANSRIAELEATVDDFQRERELANRERELSNARIAQLESQIAELMAASGKPGGAVSTRSIADTGLVGSVMSNPLLLGAGVLVLGLLALLVARLLRRRKEEEHVAIAGFGAEPSDSMSAVSVPGGETVDTDTGASSVLDSDFSQTGLSAIDADEGVDPVAEADVYLAYGRDAQAEEILLDALKVDSSRNAIYLKLLEVYVQRADRHQFEVIATDFYSRTGGEGLDWQKASAMGRKLDPDNPLYGAVAATTTPEADVRSAAAAGGIGLIGAAAAAEAATSDETDDALDDTQLRLGRDATPLPSIESVADEAIADDSDAAVESKDIHLDDLDFDMPDDLDETPAQTSTAESDQVESDALSFDLDLDGPEVDAPELGSHGSDQAVQSDSAEGSAPDAEESTFMDLERTEFDANLLDFDLDLSSPAPDKGDATAGIDLSNVEADLEHAAEAESAPATNPESAEGQDSVVPQFSTDDLAHEMDTKLELARAYDEMGDREGARELLDEVIKEGSAEQREAAQRLLDRLA